MPDLDTIIGWALVGISAAYVARCILRALDDAAGRHVDQMVADALNDIADEDDNWLDWDVLDMNRAPTYPATAEHIAKWAADDIDRKWAELNGEVG